MRIRYMARLPRASCMLALLLSSAAQDLHPTATATSKNTLKAATTRSPFSISLHSPLRAPSRDSLQFEPLRGVGVNVVNIFWERLSSALGDEVNGAPTTRKPRLRPIDPAGVHTAEPGLSESSPLSTTAEVDATTTGFNGASSPPTVNSTNSLPIEVPPRGPLITWQQNEKRSSGENRHSFRDLRARGIDLVSTLTHELSFMIFCFHEKCDQLDVASFLLVDSRPPFFVTHFICIHLASYLPCVKGSLCCIPVLPPPICAVAARR